MRGIDKSIVQRWWLLDQKTLMVQRWQLRRGNTERIHNLKPGSARRARTVNVAKAMRAA